MRVIVCGLKGSGKTTVIKKVLEKNSNIKFISAGNYFENVFKKYGLKRDEGDLGIKNTEYIKFDKEVFEEIGKEAKKHEDVIIDTHLFLTKKTGYYPGLTWFKLKEIKPDTIIILEYNPEFILKRRQKDIEKLGRERSAELTVEGIEKEQEVQRHYAFVASGLIGCTVKIIRKYSPEKYDFEHAELNAKEILKLFE